MGWTMGDIEFVDEEKPKRTTKKKTEEDEDPTKA
jgi:hypothetical protein